MDPNPAVGVPDMVPNEDIVGKSPTNRPRRWQHGSRQYFKSTEAEAYAADFTPFDSAGGYRIEDAGIRLFESITSDDYTGIIGLPLLATARLFREVGLLPSQGLGEPLRRV